VGLSELAIVGIAGMLALGLVELTIRRTDVGAVLLLFMLVVEEALPHVDLSVFVGPFRVSTRDLLFLVLITAGTARLLRLRRLTPPQRLLVFFLMLVLWSLFRGIELFAVASSVNEARQHLRFIAAVLYFSTVEPRQDILERVGVIWLGAALAIGAIALVRWSGNAVGLVGGFFGDGADLRVVPAGSALVMGQGLLIAIPLLGNLSRALQRLIAPLLLVLVVLLQHRSVWIVTAVGILYLALRDRELSRRLANTLVVGIVMFSVLLFAGFQDREEQVCEQLADSAQSTDTFEWRLDGWVTLFRDSAPAEPAEWLLGKPFGSGWERVSAATGQEIEVSPHNLYIEVLLREGIVGLMALLLTYRLAIRGTARSIDRRSAGERILTPDVLHVIVSMQLLYFIVYSATLAQGMLLGLACAFTVRTPADEAKLLKSSSP
jgi:hypothetical protein